MSLQRNIANLENQLSQLQNELLELRNAYEDEASADNDEPDISMIEHYARQASFVGHGCRNLTPFVLRRYCTFLAGAAVWLADKEKKIRQYYFISRIFYSCGQGELLADLIRDAQLISPADMEQFKSELSVDMQKVFLIDLLLMISMDGSTDEKQLEYFCEMYSFFFRKVQELSPIIRAVGAILTKDPKKIGGWTAQISIALIKCYFKDWKGISIVADFSSLVCAPEKDIIVCGARIYGRALYLDEIRKTNIRFVNCTFSEIPTMKAERTHVVLENCRFENCSGKNPDKFRYGSFYFNNAEIKHCKFINCQANEHERASCFIEIKSGSIEDTLFEKCSINAKPTVLTTNNGEYAFGAVLNIEEATVSGCEFRECKALCKESNGSTTRSGTQIWLHFGTISWTNLINQRLHMIYSLSGSIKDCSFIQCQTAEAECVGPRLESQKRNYLINTKSGTEENNRFRSCVAPEMVGSVKWEI